MSAPAQNDFDALLELSEFEANYQSPSLSPNMSSKPSYASPISDMTPPSVSSTTTTQAMNGPSHNYDMYRQQTGFVPGALANTMAVNQTNNTGYQDFGSLDYLTTFSPENDVFDFNTSPSQATLPASDLDMDFDASTTDQFFTVNPSNIEQPATGGSPPSVGRLWPGAHSQAAAVAKAQAQQRQMMQQNQSQKARGKAPQASDPIVEQKITQLLNNMRAKPASGDAASLNGGSSMPRTKKAEEDMDEDERLLASEEGKKLSSKERRQLRNKVSARAFRSRRKEYITQLESERDNKDEEVTALRQSNRALMEENKRLSDLTRMLLSSPSFSNFLDHLSTNSAAIPQPLAQVKVEPQPEEQQQQQVPKDVNPYGAQSSQQQIGMAMIPEQTMDYSMLALDGYNFQPTVFAVETPEIPAPIDAAVLSGKTSNFVESLTDDEKVEAPVIERPVQVEATEPADVAPVDDKFESDPEFALFHAQSVSVPAESTPSESIAVFGGIDAEKALSRFELVDATEEEECAAYAMARVQRIAASAESVVARLELLTLEL